MHNLAVLLLLATARLSSAPTWSMRITLGGKPLTLRIWKKRSAPTKVEVLRRRHVIALMEDDLYFDGSPQPRVWPRGREAILAYAANPGAGSGQYASLWRIGDRGRRLVRLGSFRNADLRDWPRRGIVREIRPTKYATADILKAFPMAFDEERYRDARFVVAYRYSREAGRLRLVGVRLATEAELDTWPYAVRFPGG